MTMCTNEYFIITIFCVITARKSVKEIFPVPSLSTSLIIFLISSFFGSNPRALMATCSRVKTTCIEAQHNHGSNRLFIYFIFHLLWAPWHQWIQIHLCQTVQRPPWSPASAPLWARVWGWSSCEEGALDPAGMVSWRWSPVADRQRRRWMKWNTNSACDKQKQNIIYRFEGWGVFLCGVHQNDWFKWGHKSVLRRQTRILSGFLLPSLAEQMLSMTGDADLIANQCFSSELYSLHLIQGRWAQRKKWARFASTVMLF